MIKITRETELKKGMKIKFHNSIYEINGFGNNMPLDNCIDKDWVRIKCICVPEMNSVKATKLFLIDSNAEIIEEEIKEKVVVSEEVSDILKDVEELRKSKKRLQWMSAIGSEIFLRAPLGSKFEDWLEKNNVTDDLILKIFENGWEVEKSKRPRARCGENYWFIRVMDGIVSVEDAIEDGHETDKLRYDNHIYEVKEEVAKAKAEQIRVVLRGGSE